MQSAAMPQEMNAASETLVDQGGRPLGPRALQTRKRILDATVHLLSKTKMRDLRVIDIAREIGSSPATFYQYFKDVEDVVLYLATEASERTPEIVELVRGSWEGPEGLDRGRRLASLVMDHWDLYGPSLLVRNHASDEGDERFVRVRKDAMLPIVRAFGKKIIEVHPNTANQGSEIVPGTIDPTTGGIVLTSMLERLSIYHRNVEEIGVSRERLIETAATLMQSLLSPTGK